MKPDLSLRGPASGEMPTHRETLIWASRFSDSLTMKPFVDARYRSSKFVRRKWIGRRVGLRYSSNSDPRTQLRPESCNVRPSAPKIAFRCSCFSAVVLHFRQPPSSQQIAIKTRLAAVLSLPRLPYDQCQKYPHFECATGQIPCFRELENSRGWPSGSLK